MSSVRAHLTDRYGIEITATTELDAGVYRVDRATGPAWVARVFPVDRPVTEVEGDAAILRALADTGFPAERCAVPEPVSTLDDRGVLVTEFVEGTPGRGARTLAVLGALLGRLHARSGDSSRPGGGWHTVAPRGGGPRAEIDGTLALLEHPELRDRLAAADDLADLPQAFTHPDLVPRNAITTPDGRTVVIDWTNAGRGPRVATLGFLLWAAGPRLVDTVLTRYARHVRPDPAELDRLPAAIALRPLVLDCWSVAVGRRPVAAVLRELASRDELVTAIAERAREAFRRPTLVAVPARPAPALPTTTLLSRALVAYTIELDNEFERRMPHRTTRHGGTRATPWLTSLAMWETCLRHLDEDGLPVTELARRAGTGTNVGGMRRWGYVTVDPGPPELLRPTTAGRRARDVWSPLGAEIDERWRERFGEAAVRRLRSALAEVADPGLPDYLPILGPGLVGRLVERVPPGATGPALTLSTLLARALLTVAVPFEREAKLSLAISANVLRVLDGEGVRVRDLPAATGVSREAVDVSVAHLERQGHAVLEPAADRGKQVRLTERGRAAHAATGPLLARLEGHLGEVRAALEPFGGEGLLVGLRPYPDGWRKAAPVTLPHYPMVLHRGGYPDGS